MSNFLKTIESTNMNSFKTGLCWPTLLTKHTQLVACNVLISLLAVQLSSSQKIHSWIRKMHFLRPYSWQTDVYCVLSQTQYVIWAETKTPWCSPAPQSYYQNQCLVISSCRIHNDAPVPLKTWVTVFLIDKIRCPRIKVYVSRAKSTDVDSHRLVTSSIGSICFCSAKHSQSSQAVRSRVFHF